MLNGLSREVSRSEASVLVGYCRTEKFVQRFLMKSKALVLISEIGSVRSMSTTPEVVNDQ